MNNEIEILNDWFKANRLSLNASKTNCVLFDMRKNNLNTSHYELKINQTVIERVKSVKFLGIRIDENIDWQEQTEYCRNKMKSGLYALNLCKRYLTSSTLRMLYYSLIHPYILYGIMLWGSAYRKYINPLIILQKRAIRIIAKAAYNDHSSPLFRKYNILNIDDIYKSQLGRFMYSFYSNILPQPLLDMYTLNHTVHSYGTRRQNEVHYDPIKTPIMLRSFIHNAPNLWSKLPSSVKEANSRKSFVNRIKKHLSSNY